MATEPRHSVDTRLFGSHWRWARDIPGMPPRGRGWFHTGLHHPGEGRPTVDDLRGVLRAGEPIHIGTQMFKLVFHTKPSQYVCDPPTIFHVEIVPTDGATNVVEFVAAEHADA